ncbi:hypothetical protein BY458DRAFT_558857 [Sporodiniella umbellata]|nr:hypothetical protein BY458DRAFT_558857 [Sporodiniella umbellata]
MQPNIESKLNKNQSAPEKSRNRRRRHRNRRKQPKSDEVEREDLRLDKESALNLTDLASEAHALEKQLSELQKQLRINHSNVPSKEQGRAAFAIANAQITTTEDEMDYVRQSLKKTYQQILDTDLDYAANYHIEDKTWRYIFYTDIESIRNKLRHMPEDKELEKQLLTRIELAFNFYRGLNSKIKQNHHVEDTKIFGIEQFLYQNNERLGHLLQFNYLCLGDLSRYHAQQATQTKNKKHKEYWSLAKTCYLKAAEVFRLNGKPYSQLALVSMSNGNAIDVVWYYCMSLAVKQPSAVARDNLNSFYLKLKRSTSKAQTGRVDMDLISQFVESFLHMHKTVMFPESEENEGFPDMQPIVEQLGQAIYSIIKDQNEKTSTVLHILKTMLTRTITISMVSIWVAGERLKDKTNHAFRPQILSSQVYLYTFIFLLLKSVYQFAKEAFNDMEDKTLESTVDEILLQGLSTWSVFVSTNFTFLLQHCSAVSTRYRDTEKKELISTIQSLVSFLVSHRSFPDPVLNTLPLTFPLSEDLSLLGLVPLIRFHQKVDFFKEQNYESEQNSEAKKQVRWGRIRDMIKKMADSTAFDFIQYSPREQNYSIIDLNAKRQQQNRFMKAMATQRLMEQVSSLEKNVNRMSPFSLRKEDNAPKDVYLCVVDVTVFLDGLPKVKRWASQSVGNSCLEIIVPLEVINLLDTHKKGGLHMNVQARESIRYLDQKLLEAKVKEVGRDSHLRTQKIDEKLSDWALAEEYWMGDQQRPQELENLLLSEHERNENSEDEDNASVVSEDSSASSDIVVSRSRRTRDDFSDAETSDEEDVYDYEDLENEQNMQDENYVFDDVPMKYRPIINCLLYYYSQQETDEGRMEKLVLITNDDELAFWAESFGSQKTSMTLFVKSVDEWDTLVSTVDFEESYQAAWDNR